MAEIIIKEVDATTPGINNEIPTEVAFVPGFIGNFDKTVSTYNIVISKSAPLNGPVSTILSDTGDIDLYIYDNSLPYAVDLSQNKLYRRLYVSPDNTVDDKITYPCEATDEFVDLKSISNTEPYLSATYTKANNTPLDEGIEITANNYIEYLKSPDGLAINAFIQEQDESYSGYGFVINIPQTINILSSMNFAEDSPVLCLTEAQFIEAFGDKPYQFTKDIFYSDIANDESTPLFDEKAIPSKDAIFINNGDYDKSYIYARELLALGLPVLYYAYINRSDEGYPKIIDSSISDFYSTLADKIGEIDDKNEYTVKYLTTGGYPVFEYNNNSIVYKMLEVCSGSGRGDAVAIIDHTNNPVRPLHNSDDTVFNVINAEKPEGNAPTNSLRDDSINEFGTMFTPWATYTVKNTFFPEIRNVVLPASFGYLAAMAISLKTNASWLAVAGVTRGTIPQIKALNTFEKLTNKIADAYQPKTGIAINAITNIKPYGLTIWGNRTLKDNKEGLVATSFLNIRNLVSDVKKTVYRACQQCMFEQNTDILWINFKSKITPLLDQMQSGQGLSGYKIIKGHTTEKAKLVASIILYPVYALESITVEIRLEDEEITVD